MQTIKNLQKLIKTNNINIELIFQSLDIDKN